MPEVPAQLASGRSGVILRRLSESDSLDELTVMLHRAFARLAQMGLNCTCIDQTVAVTRERIGKGECYVAVADGHLVGTITLYRPDSTSESTWYQRQAVASIHQLAVDPELQDRGLGTVLLKFAEDWARARGYREIALDTPEPANHLVAFYRSRGYRVVESLKLQGKQYRSVVLSKGVKARHTVCAFASRSSCPRQSFSLFVVGRSEASPGKAFGHRITRFNRKTRLHHLLPTTSHGIRLPLRC